MIFSFYLLDTSWSNFSEMDQPGEEGATAPFLVRGHGVNKFGDNTYFVLLETIEMYRGYQRVKDAPRHKIWPVSRG